MKDNNYKYGRYINPNQETRWATTEEIQRASTYIDLSQDKYPGAGLPLLSNGREAYVDNKDKKLKVEERKKVLDILKDYMNKKDISLNIPMLSDANSYFEGYELFIQNFDSKDKKKAMRMLFDAIAEMKTSDVQNETERRELIHSLEYNQLSEESDQLLVCEYVKKQMGQVDNDIFNMNVYFEKGHQFAQVEHVRWNAYVRTEGFRRADTPDKKYRKYKMHYDIVPVELLTFADCIKDI